MRYLDFLKRQMLVGHASGIPVRVDYRWFFVLALMSWVTASSIHSLVGNALTSFVFGLLTTLVLFVSIFLHEYAHAVAAKMENVPVVEIVLHPFGGLTRLRREPDTPRAEFRIAIAGPAASFMLAVVFALLMGAVNALDLNILALLFFTLALLNFMLAVFNLFPGYPLDGGRVLRAYLWRRGKDLSEATILTGRCGQIIGVALIVFGLFNALFLAQVFTGFWTILVGFFLYDAAKGIIREVAEMEHLSVGEAMQLPVTVEPDADVQHFIDVVLPLHRHSVFPVAKNKQLYGILLLEDLKAVPTDSWRATKIQNVMRPVNPDYFVEADAPLTEAKKLMRENGVGSTLR